VNDENPGGASGILKGTENALDHFRTFEKLLDNFKTFEKLLAQVEPGSIVAFDVETGTGDVLLGISFGFGPVLSDCVYISVLDWTPLQVQALFHRFPKNVIWTAHYGMYDLDILSRCGVEIDLGFDTYIASRWLHPKSIDYSLKYMARTLLDMPAWGSALALINDHGGMENVPFETLQDYARRDAVATYRLTELYRPEINEKMMKVVMALECAMVREAVDMKRIGIPVDRNALAQIRNDLHQARTQLADEIARMVGHTVYLSSPEAVSQVLFGELKVPPGRTPKTKKGWYSTKAEYLEELKMEHPVIAKILEWRHIEKLIGTYIDQLPGTIGNDNRVHPRWDPLGAATGRSTCTNPAMQTFPVRSAVGRVIRRAFVAPEGYYLVSADYKQIELACLADLSGSRKLKQIFMEGGDIHRATAALVFGKPEADITKQDREVGKVINFGLIYGMSPFGLMHYGFTGDQCRDFYERYFRNFDGVRELIAKYHSQIYKHYVTTKYGRRIRLPEVTVRSSEGYKSGARRQAQNSPIQGTAADILKIAHVRLGKHIRSERLNPDRIRMQIIMTIHDELVFIVKKEHLHRAAHLIREQMTSIPFGVPLRIDLAYGPNWCDLIDYEFEGE
jgi:DNA polymerase I